MDWRTIVSGVLAVVGSATFISGVTCVLTHLGAGDLGSHWQECLVLLASGSGIASPGVNTLKAGVFSRPPAQQTKDPVSGEKR